MTAVGTHESVETSTTSPSVSSARRLRQFAVAFGVAGVLALLVLAVISPLSIAGVVADVAVASLGVAIVLGVVDVIWKRPDVASRETVVDVNSASLWSTRWTAGAVAVITFAAVQMWFNSGTEIAGGDIQPPDGTAWIAHLFTPGTSANFGAAGAQQLRAPWAAVAWVVHAAGGSGAVAQRLWLSGLFVGAALAAFALLRLLRVLPVPAAIGALAYVFSPFVVSNVGTNDVYLAAMVLLAAWPACILASITRRWRRRTCVMGLGLTAPLLGFAFQNPPLVGMVVLAALATVPLAMWLEGPRRGWRAAQTLGLSVPVLLACSVYWLIPEAIQLHSVASGALSPLSSWAWTEPRANLTNGLWLNTTWGWTYPQYFPFARTYATFPLSFIKYLPPLAAFGAVPLALGLRRRSGDGRRARLVLAAAAVALFLVVLGTGTNEPGSVIFDPLYRLPFGWLLQDPGRFLMAADLAYGVLVAVAINIYLERKHAPDRDDQLRPQGTLLHAAAVGVIAVLVIGASGFPLISGSVVPNTRPQLPPAHVRVPSYWTSMASYIATDTSSGNLLVLPPDDFYAMPYTWGYYGNDGFISDMTGREVLDPSAQTYYGESGDLMSTVHLFAQSLLNGDWALSRRLLYGLGATQILVRGDIDSTFPGRNIISPAALAAALAQDPYVTRTHQAGPLELYRAFPAVRAEALTVSHSFATVNSSVPNLRLLSLLRPDELLVTSPHLRRGIPGILQLPSLQSWHLAGQQLTTTIQEPTGWTYRTSATPSPTSGGTAFLENSEAVAAGRVARYRLPLSANLLTDGDFRQGGWQSVGNCDAVAGTQRTADIRATVVPDATPNGSPALDLAAALDSACESQAVTWHSGPVVVQLTTRTLAGPGPSICLWEAGPNHCAALSALATSGQWQDTHEIVTPDPGTTSLRLYIYATAQPKQPADVEYADMEVSSIPTVLAPTIIATPAHPPAHAPTLVVSSTGFGPGWVGPPNSTQVIVDGMRNGWLSTTPLPDSAARYAPTRWYIASEWVSILSILGLLVVACLLLGFHLRRRRTSPSASEAS